MHSYNNHMAASYDFQLRVALRDFPTASATKDFTVTFIDLCTPPALVTPFAIPDQSYSIGDPPLLVHFDDFVIEPAFCQNLPISYVADSQIGRLDSSSRIFSFSS